MASEIGEGAAQAFGHALGHWIMALHDGNHHLGGEPPGIGQPDRPGVAKVQPSGPAVESIDHLPCLLAAGPDRQRQARLALVPYQFGAALSLARRHEQIGQLALVDRRIRGAVSSGPSRHVLVL
jgi:hypothetical protein